MSRGDPKRWKVGDAVILRTFGNKEHAVRVARVGRKFLYVTAWHSKTDEEYPRGFHLDTGCVNTGGSERVFTIQEHENLDKEKAARDALRKFGVQLDPWRFNAVKTLAIYYRLKDLIEHEAKHGTPGG